MGGGGGVLKSVLPIAASALGGYFLGPMIAPSLVGAGASATAAGLTAAQAASAGTAIGSAVGGLAGSAVSGGMQQPKIEMPGISTPTAIPQIGGSETLAAERKTLASMRMRQGRAASILSQDGMNYSSSKLGG